MSIYIKARESETSRFTLCEIHDHKYPGMLGYFYLENEKGGNRTRIAHAAFMQGFSMPLFNSILEWMFENVSYGDDKTDYSGLYESLNAAGKYTVKGTNAKQFDDVLNRYKHHLRNLDRRMAYHAR
jgi:hypothetical protein